MDSLLPLAKKVGEKLKARKETVGVSESSAGGLISAVFSAVLPPLLPRGRTGGIVSGALLLLLAGVRMEPLREDDFDVGLLGAGRGSSHRFPAPGARPPPAESPGACSCSSPSRCDRRGRGDPVVRVESGA